MAKKITHKPEPPRPKQSPSPKREDLNKGVPRSPRPKNPKK